MVQLRLALAAVAVAFALAKVDIRSTLRRAQNWLQRALPERSRSVGPALLMTADELYSRLLGDSTSDRRLVIIEVAHPSKPGASPRIPTSHRVWRPEYQLPVSATQPIDGLAPNMEQFEEFAQRLGIDEDSDVVLISELYDCTRLWWLFTGFGKRNVYVLDGGFAEWKQRAASKPFTALAKVRQQQQQRQQKVPQRGNWKARSFDAAMVATRAAVARLREVPQPRLWDVRTPEEFDGSVTLAGAARGGRIPWATKRVEWGMFRRGDGTGTWLPPNEIANVARRELSVQQGDTSHAHVFYCQSGVRTTQLIFGLCLAGWPVDRLKNYDGSWIEWSHEASDEDVLRGDPTDEA